MTADEMFLALILALFLTTASTSEPLKAGDDIALGMLLAEVDTKYGRVQGHFFSTQQQYNNPFSYAFANIFAGIPYAAKPINDLRLEKPEPVEPWRGTLDAKHWPLPCTPQCKKLTEYFTHSSEDCLYLNIFTPSTPPQDGLYPVAVFLHGGGFMFGDTQSYGYEGFVKNYISKGIVVVTVQYRLGPFGWFSLGDQVAPGNLGLWDQRQALLFLHDVLKDFGVLHFSLYRINTHAQFAHAKSRVRF